MKEFEIIKKFFTSQETSSTILVGIGDDAAIVNVPANKQLAVTTDTLIENVHFPKNTSAFDVGYKALAVSLSDLAAMNASPAWMTLALTLPNNNSEWLHEFAKGFFEIANRYEIKLIGGDTTQGPLSITVQALGLVNPDENFLRKNAKPSELIFVSNTLGDAGVGLQILKDNVNVDDALQNFFLNKLNRPEPQLELAKALQNLTRCAIDISDGLASDLQHILTASDVGAEIYLEKLPLSNTMQKCFSKEEGIQFALTSGDDYELCFTVNEAIANENDALLKKLNCTCIGKITAEKKLNLFLHGELYQHTSDGYEHFS